MSVSRIEIEAPSLDIKFYWLDVFTGSVSRLYLDIDSKTKGYITPTLINSVGESFQIN